MFKLFVNILWWSIASSYPHPFRVLAYRAGKKFIKLRLVMKLSQMTVYYHADLMFISA